MSRCPARGCSHPTASEGGTGGETEAWAGWPTGQWPTRDSDPESCPPPSHWAASQRPLVEGPHGRPSPPGLCLAVSSRPASPQSSAVGEHVPRGLPGSQETHVCSSSQRRVLSDDRPRASLCLTDRDTAGGSEPAQPGLRPRCVPARSPGPQEQLCLGRRTRCSSHSSRGISLRSPSLVVA